MRRHPSSRLLVGLPLTPGRPAEIVFAADAPGRIEVELEKSRPLLVRLVIS